jgi:Secretion system C-terminal sorting domain
MYHRMVESIFTRFQYFLICLAFSFIFQNVSGQKLINTTGTTVTDTKYIIEYSVGEISIATLTAPSGASSITQGLLQPNIKVINPACAVVNDTINCFPNPVDKILSVVGRVDWITGYHIYAADGKLVRVANFVNNQINMYNLPDGAYFIKLYPGCDDKFRVLKVIKR